MGWEDKWDEVLDIEADKDRVRPFNSMTALQRKSSIVRRKTLDGTDIDSTPAGWDWGVGPEGVGGVLEVGVESSSISGSTPKHRKQSINFELSSSRKYALLVC